jgi:hypothetical protein
MNTSPQSRTLVSLLAITMALPILPRIFAEEMTPNPSTPPVATAVVKPQASGGKEGKGGKEKRGNKGMESLTEAERQQLDAAMKKIADDPEWVAAKQSAKDAQTPEAKKETRKSMGKLRHDLLLKADPTLQPILEKMRPPGGKKGQN